MYNRICIIGGSGTGKTTLANKLSEIYGLPAIHIDGINYLSDWKARNKEERDKIILSLLENEKWIIDGIYKTTLKPRLEKADLIVWLDYSTFAQMKGILKRFFTIKGKERTDIPGCKEKMSREFFFYTLNFRRKNRHHITDNIVDIDNSKILRFTNRRKLNKWLLKIQKATDEK